MVIASMVYVGLCRLLLGEDALAMLCVIPDLTIKPVRLGSHASRSLLACRLWVTAETCSAPLRPSVPKRLFARPK